MAFSRMLQLFAEQSPAAVMVRGTLETVFAPERLDRIFEETAKVQYCKELLFSTCADIMALVVHQVRPSVNAAYKARPDLPVAVKSVYNKLAGIEPAVSERMVCETACDLAKVMRQLGPAVESPLPGFECRIIDGNHLAGTEHRLKPLRRLGAAALPGQSIAVLNPQLRLVEHVVTWEDGHANERVLFPRVLELVRPHECWIADRNFCVLAFLFGLDQRRASFVIRHHQQLQGESVGRRRKIGRSETGIVYEQGLRIHHGDGTSLLLRRIVIERDQPTQKGETQIALLSNLPRHVSALRIAHAYRERWRIENAFQELATTLRSEINTLGYPKAALFGFCVALVLFNIVSVVKKAMEPRSKPAGPPRAKLSSYYLVDEVAGVWRGMQIAVPAAEWTRAFASLTPRQLAVRLKSLSGYVRQHQFTTNPWTPKRSQPKRISGNRGNHVSTARIMEKIRDAPSK
jgi:IS4 transposase